MRGAKRTGTADAMPDLVRAPSPFIVACGGRTSPCRRRRRFPFRGGLPLQNLSDFFLQVYFSFRDDLSLIDKVFALLPYIGTVVGIPLFFWHYFRGRNKNLSVELAEETEAKERWIRKHNALQHKLDTEIAAELEKLPENWMAGAAKEREDGNEERALGRLRDGFLDAGPHLAAAADELAGYHLSVAYDFGGEHFAEARRFGRLAVLHGGASAGREAVLDELDLIAAPEEDGGGEAVSGWDDLHAAFPSGEDGLAAIRQINALTGENLDRGRYEIADRLNRRALLIASRYGAPLDTDVLATRNLQVSLLNCRGHYEEAMAEIDAFLPLHTDAPTQLDPLVFRTRGLRVQALHGLGRNKDALAEIDSFAGLQAEVVMEKHPDLFATRLLRAESLRRLGRFEEALSQIDAFAPLLAEALTETHPYMFAARHLRAQALAGLGRHKESLTEIDAFLPLQVQTMLESDSNMLRSRWLRARVLDNLGRLQEALAEIDAFAPIQAEALSPEHPHVRDTAELRAEIIAKLG